MKLLVQRRGAEQGCTHTLNGKLSMVFYEVNVTVRPDLRSSFMTYMREKHIPEIWETRCFQHIHFDEAGDNVFRTCYQAATSADYQRYLDQYASAMRADFLQHFPDGCAVSRQVWTGLQSWGH